jgi:hypothetical protein
MGCGARAYRRARVNAADVRNRSLATDRRTRHCFSSALGLAVHLLIGAVLGMSYGLLFRDEAPTAGWSFLWGSVSALYGVSGPHDFAAVADR